MLVARGSDGGIDELIAKIFRTQKRRQRKAGPPGQALPQPASLVIFNTQAGTSKSEARYCDIEFPLSSVQKKKPLPSSARMSLLSRIFCQGQVSPRSAPLSSSRTPYLDDMVRIRTITHIHHVIQSDSHISCHLFTAEGQKLG